MISYKGERTYSYLMIFSWLILQYVGSVSCNCSPGEYSNGTTCLDCPRGTYCPNSGMTAPIVCPRGSKCPYLRSPYAYKCSFGFYQEEPGKSYCVECPVGYYCPSEGLIFALGCSSGHYCKNSFNMLDSESATVRHSDNIPSNQWSQYAIDDDPACSRTALETFNRTHPAWWRVEKNVDVTWLSSFTFETELASLHYFSGFKILVEIDPSFSLYETDLSIPGSKSTVCYEHENSPPDNISMTITCDPPIAGNRFVLQHASLNTQLVLCKVEVTGVSGGEPKPCPKGEYQPSNNKGSCLPCDPGYYCPHTGCSWQHSCSKGFMCPYNDRAPTKCPPGTFQSEVSQVSCTNCTPGYYCPEEGLTAPTLCSYNTKCPGTGNINPQACVPFTTSKAGQEKCTCVAGYYCTNGDENPTKCPVGHYCFNETKTKCAAGTYMGNEGADVCFQCLPGYYCETEGLSAVTGACWIGHFCQNGTILPTPCPHGYYQAAEGKATCDICPIGYYCNQTEATRDKQSGVDKPTHGVVTPTKCFPDMCLEPGAKYFTCISDPFESGNLNLNISCKPSCNKYMTAMTDLRFTVLCDECQNESPTYQWSVRLCFNENIQECGHCYINFDDFFRPSTRDFIIISHNSMHNWTYHAIVVKVTLGDGRVGMASFIWQYFSDSNVLCEISPILGLAMTTPFNVTCNEPSLPLDTSYVCSMYYAYAVSGDSIIFQSMGKCNHPETVLRQGDKEKDYRLHLHVVGKYMDHLLWDVPLMLKVDLPPVTNKELENTVDDLSGNLTESSSTEEVVEILNELQAVSFCLNDKPPDENITASENASAAEIEMIAKEQNRKIREAVLQTISTVNTSNVEIMISVATTLNQVTLKKEELSTEAKDQAFDMYNTFTEDFKANEETTSDEDITKAAGSLLFGIGSVLDMTTDIYIEEKEDDMGEISEPSIKTTSAPITEEEKEENKKQVMEKTQQLLESVETISTIIFKRQDVDSEPAVFESPVMSISIAKVSPKNLVGKPIKASDYGDDSKTSMILPEDLELPDMSTNDSDSDDSVRTEFLLLKKNPFVWGENSKDIKAPVVSFELKNSRNDILHVSNLSTPVKVHLPQNGGEMVGTIPFLFRLQKLNETIKMMPGEGRPCAATFEITMEPDKVTVFSMSIPDNLTTLLSVNMKEKFDLSTLPNNGKGFRYPEDSHIINKFYGHLSEIEADIFDNATLYCKACSEICCNTTIECTGFYEHCMYYCKKVIHNPFTENCTSVIDLSIFCDSCERNCCDKTSNCKDILENCVFMCAVHKKEAISTECKTSLAESYAKASDLSLKLYCEDCEFFCCEFYDSESCFDIYINCVYFCSNFYNILSCNATNKMAEVIFLFPRHSAGNDTKKMYFGLSIDSTEHKVLKYFKELDPVCLGNISSTSCSSDIDLEIPLKVSAMGCNYWDAEKEIWSTDGMKISSESSGTVLLCTSNHLTAFSKTVLVAPTFIDPLDVQLFASFFDNPVIVTVVIVVWMIYFFLVHWARQKDKSDEEQVGVIYCSDNVVTDSYTYVVCISTGWWNQAGTTANVYIYLKGSEDISPRKSLKTPVRNCFQTGFEDWFLITTEHSLGDIKSVTLWHDNMGSSPHWFVNQIFVKDVHTDNSWTFVFNDWLAVDRGNLLLTTATLQPVTREELELKKKFNFMITTTQSFRDGHIWISIFSKPASNTFTRVQRLTCCLTLLLLTMLTNLMFYGIPTDDPEDQLVTGAFKLSLSQIVIGIESSLILFPVNLLIVQLFTKVKPKPVSGRSPIPIECYLEAIMGKQWEQIMNNMYLQFKYLTKTYHPGMTFFTKRQRPDERTVVECVHSEIATRKKGHIFPWWFVYIAWSVSMTTCLVSSYCVALYGLKYGYNRSVEWLVSFFTGFFQSVFVQQPVKVIGIAFILTLLFKKTASVDESVPVSKRDADVEYLRSVYIKPPEAHQDIMEPLPKRLLNQIKERLKREWLMNLTIQDIFFHLFYVAVVLIMVHGHRNIQGSFLCMQTVRSLFVTPSDGIEMEMVSNKDEFAAYLQDTVIPAMTDITSDHEYATLGSNHYLVGTYRLRQLRIKAVDCEPILSGLPIDCKGPYLVREEDTRDYNKSWLKPLYSSNNATSDIKSSHWKYRSTWDLKTLPFPGIHGTYTGGGYVLELPANVSLHSDIFSELFSEGWIDKYTRAVFIEFTLYNPNVDLFTIAVYLFEFTNVGRIFPMNNEFTSSLYHYTTDYQTVVAVCEVLFVCFTVLFIFHEVKKLNHLGKYKYFSDIWTIVELVQIALSITLLGIFVKRFMTINNTLAEFKDTGNDKFINFYSAIFWDFVFGYISAVLIGLVTLKTMKHVRYNNRIKVVFVTIDLVRPVFVGYVIGFAIMTISFANLGYLWFGHSRDDYKSFYDSWVSIILILLGVGDFVGLQDAFSVAGPLFIVAVIMIIHYVLMVMMTTILNVGRLEAKHELSKKKSKFALVKYMRSRVKLLLDIK